MSHDSANTPTEDPNESRIEHRGGSKNRQKHMNALKSDFSKALKHITKLEEEAKDLLMAKTQAQEKQAEAQREHRAELDIKVVVSELDIDVVTRGRWWAFAAG